MRLSLLLVMATVLLLGCGPRTPDQKPLDWHHAQMRKINRSQVTEVRLFVGAARDLPTTARIRKEAETLDADMMNFTTSDPAIIDKCYSALMRLSSHDGGREDRDSRLDLVVRDGDTVSLSLAFGAIRSDFGPEVEGCVMEVARTGKAKPY